MTSRASFGQISDSEYSNLLDALSASAKGRSFLNEYRRRARPEETGQLLEALYRIDTTIAAIRDQLQPERIADELRRVAITLEIATEGAPSDPDGDERARRMALIDSVRREITVLADGLAAHVAQPPGTRGKPNREANEAAPDRIQLDWA